MAKKSKVLSQDEVNKLLNKALIEPAIKRNNPAAWIKIVEKLEKDRPKK